VLAALIKAYEIQGCLSLENDFNASAMDHVILTRVATAGVVTRMLGGDVDAVLNAVSNAWLEVNLRVYRQDPGTGPRKGWAAADASAHAVRLALMSVKGEPGYPRALTAPKWGFYDVYRGGKPFAFQRPYGEYIIQQVTLKASAACMHAQSAVECGVRLHPVVRGRLNAVERIEIFSHRALIGIIDKTGPLRNAADRDHCARYIVAIALIFGRLNPADFEDAVASDPRIDALRSKMVIIEDPAFSRDYYDPAKRANGNGVRVHFTDGTSTERIDVEYPPGHPRRRAETSEIFRAKFVDALAMRFPQRQRERILEVCDDPARFDGTRVNEFMDLLAI
jgi:2-methylcitrate dehydratase